VQDDLDGWMIAVSGDLCRSLKRPGADLISQQQRVGFR
jgi:hypothetical protein